MTESTYAAEHKVPPFTVERLTNRAVGFYETVGPFLSRREIVAELGNPVWDDDGKTWLVASTDDEVLGIVGVKAGEICSLYVTPTSRGQLVGYALLYNALRMFDGQPLRATATEASREMFAGFGFEETGQRGRYYVMRRPA